MDKTAIDPPTHPAHQSAIEDDHLVDRLRAGDQRAFEAIMRRHNARLFRCVNCLIRDRSRAEDVVQNSYLRAFTRIEQYRGPHCFAAWLARIAVNEALGQLRRDRRRQAVIASEGDPEREYPDPDHSIRRHQLARDIERALERIPQQFAQVFVLRRVEGASLRDTAATLEIPEDTVKSRLYRANLALQSQLGPGFEAALPEVWSIGGSDCDRLVAGVHAGLGIEWPLDPPFEGLQPGAWQRLRNRLPRWLLHMVS